MTDLAFVVSLVLLTSAACSLFEAVLYSVPAGHIESLTLAKRPAGRLLRQLRGQVDRPIAAILVLNTVANTGGAAVAGAIADEVLGHQWIAYFSAVFTLAILTFSEIVPKTAGVVYAKTLAPIIARPLVIMVWLFAPLIWLSRQLTKLIASRREEQSVSDEEILVLVRLGMRSGDFKPHESSVIQNVLALENKTAGEIMTPRTVVFALDADSTVGRLRDEPRLIAHSRIPVFDRDFDDVVGIVHRREVLHALAHDRFDVKLETLMRPVEFVVGTLPLDKLLKAFLDRRQHMLIVIDEFGGFAGVVTLEDVLEEILGREIVDEFDQVPDLRELAHRRRQETIARRTGEDLGGQA